MKTKSAERDLLKQEQVDAYLCLQVAEKHRSLHFDGETVKEYDLAEKRLEQAEIDLFGEVVK